MQNRTEMRLGVAVPPATPTVQPSQVRSKSVALAMVALALCSLMSAAAPHAEARQTWMGNKVGQTLHFNRTGQWRPYTPPYHPPTYRMPRSRPAPAHRVPSYGGTRFIF